MIDVIFAIKFVHVLAVAVLFGGWLCLALFMTFAHGTRSVSVVALVSRFAIRIEVLIAVAVVTLPASGFPLATAIGLSPSDEFWIRISIAIYGVVVVAWLAAVVVEWRIRNVTRRAVLVSAPLPSGYRRLFRFWSALAVIIIAGLVAVIVLMIWQPRMALSFRFDGAPLLAASNPTTSCGRNLALSVGIDPHCGRLAA